jgi:uncharacterized protein YneR
MRGRVEGHQAPPSHGSERTHCRTGTPRSLFRGRLRMAMAPTSLRTWESLSPPRIIFLRSDSCGARVQFLPIFETVHQPSSSATSGISGPRGRLYIRAGGSSSVWKARHPRREVLPLHRRLFVRVGGSFVRVGSSSSASEVSSPAPEVLRPCGRLLRPCGKLLVRVGGFFPCTGGSSSVWEAPSSVWEARHPRRGFFRMRRRFFVRVGGSSHTSESSSHAPEVPRARARSSGPLVKRARP